MAFKKTLYKITSIGAEQVWNIWVEGNVINTEWGQLKGAQQKTQETIREGKNLGKKNATSPEEQAASEAEARWLKKRKTGYVEHLAMARAGLLDSNIEGGILPMLAHPYEKLTRFDFPCYGQPKLDGTRCIAVIDNGECTLWSRTRKRIDSMPHIERELEEIFAGQTITLDGELYATELSADFEELVHLVRQEEAVAGSELIKYWLYDVPSNSGSYLTRNTVLNNVVPKTAVHLVVVPTIPIASESVAMEYMSKCIEDGFEGAMLRATNGTYENKRSRGLAKLKIFQDAEFKIVGYEEGRGKLAGSIGAFVCETKDGKQFKAKLKGSTTRLQDYFKKASKLLGKPLSVKYQNLTADGIPRFPVGVAVRDYE